MLLENFLHKNFSHKTFALMQLNECTAERVIILNRLFTTPIEKVFFCKRDKRKMFVAEKSFKLRKTIRLEQDRWKITLHISTPRKSYFKLFAKKKKKNK